MTDRLDIQSELVAKIRTGDQRSLTMIYADTFPMVEKYVRDNKGGTESAKDVFQDAIYILIKKVSDPDFQLTSKISTYLFGIAKNLWLKELTKKEVNKDEYKNEVRMDNLLDDESDKLVKLRRIREGLEQLGEPCKTILIQFYHFKQTMKEIATMLHYTNAENAKNQKYKCLIRLKKIITKEFGE